MKKIAFFNRFHNGDLHISREIVRLIIERVHQMDPSVSFFYEHANHPSLLSDIPNLSYAPMSSIDQHLNLCRAGDTMYINTWYAQQHYKYMNPYGMTIDCLYAALDDTCKNFWGFPLSDISQDLSKFYPTIDYSKFAIHHAQNWLSNNPQKKIFISNGHALSGQATNFPMAPIISGIATRHPDKIFILSNRENHSRLPNIVYSEDIIQKGSSDLNENGFLTTYCDVIIGRASGAFTYAWTQENMFHRKVKFISFCPPPVVFYGNHPFWTNSLFGDKIKYSAEFIATGECDPNKVASIIESNL